MQPDAGKCIIVSAPSGAGKTTIVRYLLGLDLGLAFSISATSRPRRHYEVDGHDYFFITTDAFRQRIVDGAFLEWEEVYPDRFYGTLRAEIARIWENNQAPIFDVDVVGGLHLKGLFGSAALALFIAPPSLPALEERLHSRGTETPETLKARIEKAEHEITFAPRFDAVIVNDDRDRACNEAYQRVRAFLSA
jgi:guanylate kinase